MIDINALEVPKKIGTAGGQALLLGTCKGFMPGTVTDGAHTPRTKSKHGKQVQKMCPKKNTRLATGENAGAEVQKAGHEQPEKLKL